MALLRFLPAALVTLTVLLGLATADATPCNPLNVTTACPPIPALTTNTYFMDFTQQTTTPGDWILADYAMVNYASPGGANFTINKLEEAPYIWSRFYVLFGRIEVVMKVAKGAGIITGSVMMSDDLDEIDWEFSGNNFGQNSGQAQTNYFGKGQIGWSDRGSSPAVDSPQDEYHTYALDWQSDRLIWSIDGVTVRTLNNNGATTGSYQYPQTPSRLHLGMWCAGDPSNAQGTVNWGGGYTNFSQAPFTAFVKSVNITTANTCNSWQYPYPFDGTYHSVQCSNQTANLPCTYTVVAGDDADKIASNLTVNADSLKVANPAVDWDRLLIGQVLNVPGGTCTTPSISTSVSSMTSVSTSTTTVSTTSSSMSSTSGSSTSFNSTQSLSSASSSTASASSTTISSTTTSSSTVSNTTTSVVSTSSPALTTSTSTTTTSLNSIAPISSTSGSSSATSASAAHSYTVVAGDFAWVIADKNGCSFDALDAANPGINWDNLQIGQSINVPGPSPTSSSALTSSGNSSSSTYVDLSTPFSPTSTNSNTSTSTSISMVLYPFGEGGSASATDSAATSTTSTVSSSATSVSGSGSSVSSSINPSPNGTPGTSTPTPTSSEAVSSSPKASSTATAALAITSSSNVNAVNPVTTSANMLCNQDNCLRNLIDPRYSSSMRAFCSKYTTKTSNGTPLPTFLGGCTADVKRVSSACSCLITGFGPSGTSSSSAVSPSAFKSGAPSGGRVPSWLLKGSPLRWNRGGA